MYKILPVKLHSIIKIKKIIKEYKKNTLYNNDAFKGIILFYLLHGNVYLIKQNKNEIVYVIVNSKNKCAYVISSNINKKINPALINYIYTNCKLDGYAMSLAYKSCYKADFSKYKNINVINNIKYMYINTFKSNENIDSHIEIKKFEIGHDEETRVSLQNGIFDNGKTIRRKLTVDEIINEQYNPGYMKDLCFILYYYYKPAGYGQIIRINKKNYLVNFGIIPQYRHKGLGKMLLSYIVGKVYDYGIDDLYLTVDNANFNALKLYELYGFSEVYNLLYLLKI